MNNNSDNEIYKYETEEVSVESIDDIKIINADFITANLQDAIPFRDFLLKIFEHENKNFIINLSKAEIIDSTFLGALVTVYKKLRGVDGKIVLILNESSKASAMFQITNMNEVFEVYNNLDEAIESFN